MRGGQRFEYCDFYANGSDRAPGYSHNLYLGGQEATLDYGVVRAVKDKALAGNRAVIHFGRDGGLWRATAC